MHESLGTELVDNSLWTEYEIYKKFVNWKNWVNDVILYWSWAFDQGYDKKQKEKTQLDIIIVVDDTKQYLEALIQEYPEFFSNWVTWFRSKIFQTLALDFQSFLQEKWAWMNYYPYIPLDNWEVKIWIISTKRAINDLINLEDNYFAWRATKPQKSIYNWENEEYQNAKRQNKTNAVNIAISLFLESWDNEFTWDELMKKIISISYIWESRWSFEDVHRKIEKIYNNNKEWFQYKYEKIVAEFVEKWIINKSEDWKYKITKDKKEIQLPKWIQEIIDNSTKSLEAAIKEIVGKNSKIMTIKWLFTAWPERSLRYLEEKRYKKWWPEDKIYATLWSARSILFPV